jgi:pimeloyl-ACP methyl ester carboxylesterase
VKPRKFANYFAASALALCVLARAAQPSAPGPAVVTEDLTIPALDAGIKLHVRNKRPAGATKFSAQRIVLFVHGATFPSTAGFDFPLEGGSWLEQVAVRGFDVYALDIRGYGGSTRPPAMAQLPEDNPPFASGAEALRDVAAAVDFIRERRAVARINIVGWSWGTTTTAGFAALHPDKVERLVLFGPVWLGVTAPPFKGAYRTNTRESARAFTSAGVPKDRVEEIWPVAEFDRWWTAALATDPDGARAKTPVMRAPNGALSDFAEFWARGTPTYDPARITAPTLLVVGEWDVVTPPQMALGLFKELRNARPRRVMILSEGTHFISLERNHMSLFREVQGFLEEPSFPLSPVK